MRDTDEPNLHPCEQHLTCCILLSLSALPPKEAAFANTMNTQTKSSLKAVTSRLQLFPASLTSTETLRWKVLLNEQDVPQ